MEVRDACLDDCIHWAGLFAETAVDALEEVDVVARGAARAVGAHLGVDSDGECRAHGLAELTGDAALLPVGVTTLGVKATVTRRLRRVLLWVTNGELRLEEETEGQRQALDELGEQETLDPAA